MDRVDKFLDWFFLKTGSLAGLLFVALVISLVIGGAIAGSYAGLAWMHATAAELDR